MFLGNTLSAAASGLDSVERQLATLSQNVANASTPNYVRQTTPVSSIDSAGGPAGVRTGQATREIDTQLQANLFAAVGNEAGSNAAQASLAAIDQASGVPGSGQDLSSLVGALGDAFTTLGADPSSSTQQGAVLDKAQSLADGIHSLSDSLVQTRQKAQDSLADDATAANAALKAVGVLSNQIIAAKAAGQSTAGLEDDRDGQLKTLAQLTGAKFSLQANGDVQVIAANSILPTRANNGPFSVGTVSFTAGTDPAAVPPLQLNGQAVAGLGGEMGAFQGLRDGTIPTMLGKLDAFARSIASAFQAQGMPLLTDGSGGVPTNTAGFSATVQVSAAFQAAPHMVRDGTGAAGSAGNNGLINQVLQTVFSSAADGVPAQATTLVAGFAQQAAQASSAATATTALRSGLETRLSSISGVSVDTELSHMVQLQAAYAANAKVVTAVQDMWTQLLEAIR